MDKEVPSDTRFMEILMPHLLRFSAVPIPLKFSLEDGWVVGEILKKWKLMEILLVPLDSA